MVLLPVADALRHVLDGVETTAHEMVALADAHGRVLAADLKARFTQPPFDASAMDGWAVRAADVANVPATLRVAGQAAAGERFAGDVATGGAVRIFTGAPIPSGADAVVIQENASHAGDNVIVREAASLNANIRPRGGDFASGDVLLKSGQFIDARVLALAAAMGHGEVLVHVKPRVAILATGDELVAPGEIPGPDQIVSSNPVAIAAMVRTAGGEPVDLGIARDDLAALDTKIAEAANADILVTTGGASVGDHDLIMPALKARGVDLAFWKIAMRPGKPLIYGRLGRQRVLGLPGNPVSAIICARLFLIPLVRRMLGQSGDTAQTLTARLSSALDVNGPRTHYMRASFDLTDGRPAVNVLRSQDSSLLSALAAANCLIVREPDAPAAAAGDEVTVLRLDF